jgi:hypothetical protein
MELFAPDYLKLQNQTNSLNSLLHKLTDSNTYTIDWNVYLEEYSENLQRPLVWSQTALEKDLDKWYYHRLFIESIFSYNDLGKWIFWIDPKTGVHKIIDGKQRLDCLNNWINNWFGIFRDGKEIFWKDIPTETQRKIKFNTTITVCDITTGLSDKQLVEIFLSVNKTGVPQSDVHLNKLSTFLQKKIKL